MQPDTTGSQKTTRDEFQKKIMPMFFLWKKCEKTDKNFSLKRNAETQNMDGALIQMSQSPKEE